MSEHAPLTSNRSGSGFLAANTVTACNPDSVSECAAGGGAAKLNGVAKIAAKQVDLRVENWGVLMINLP
jgi:hypothetical protein